MASFVRTLANPALLRKWLATSCTNPGPKRWYLSLSGFSLWVCQSAMLAAIGSFQGKTQARFERHDLLNGVLADLPTAQALMAHLMGLAQRRDVALDTTLPAAPTTCTGRGCTGCVWEDHFATLRQWREEACDWLSHTPECPAH